MLVKSGKMQDSIAALKLSVDSHPDSRNIQHHYCMATIFPESSSAHFRESEPTLLGQNTLTSNFPGSLSTRKFTSVIQQSVGVGKWDKKSSGLAPTSFGGMGESRHLLESLKSHSLRLGAAADYYRLGASMDRVTMSAMPDTISLPHMRNDALHTQDHVFGIVEEDHLPLKPNLSHVKLLTWTEHQQSETVEMKAWHSSSIIKANFRTPRPASTPQKSASQSRIMTLTSEPTPVQNSNSTYHVKQTSRGTDYCCPQSFSGSITDFSQHFELLHLSAVISVETATRPKYVHFGVSEIADSHARKHSSSPVISTATSIQLPSVVLTSRSGPRFSHGHGLAKTTDNSLEWTPSIPRTTLAGSSGTEISTGTSTHCTQTSSFETTQRVQTVTSIPVSATTKTHSSTIADQAVLNWHSSSIKPPDQLRTLSTCMSNAPGGSSSVIPAETTASSPDAESFFNTLSLSQNMPKRSLGISLGTASGAFVVFICIFLLHRPCYLWARGRRSENNAVDHQSDTTENMHIKLLQRRTGNPETSHFSAGS